MALANLSRPLISKRPLITELDQFLEGAELYANGRLPPQLRVINQTTQAMIRCGFTLSPQLRRRLVVDAKRQQISRSRLLRILLHHFDQLSDAQRQQLLNEHFVR